MWILGAIDGMLAFTYWGGGAKPYAHALNCRLSCSCVKMAVSTRRALHFVFKVANRTSTAAFYRDVLGMKVWYGSNGWLGIWWSNLEIESELN